MINLSAPIEPGKSAAGIELGTKLNDVLSENVATRSEKLNNCERYDFPSVSLWVEAGVVKQIGVFIGYSGDLNSNIGIESTIKDIQNSIGAVVEDEEDNLIVKELPGFCFTTEPWVVPEIVSDNPNTKITGIYVF